LRLRSVLPLTRIRERPQRREARHAAPPDRLADPWHEREQIFSLARGASEMGLDDEARVEMRRRELLGRELVRVLGQVPPPQPHRQPRDPQDLGIPAPLTG